jgi:hypothetical protein
MRQLQPIVWAKGTFLASNTFHCRIFSRKLAEGPLDALYFRFRPTGVACIGQTFDCPQELSSGHSQLGAGHRKRVEYS